MATQQQQPAQGSSSRFEQYNEMIDWQESVLFGAAAWIGSLVFAILLILGFGATDDIDEPSLLEAASIALLESVGGTMDDAIINQSTIGIYSFLDTNWFGAGPTLHFLPTLLVVTIAGFLLAGRHYDRGDTTRPLETILSGASLALPFLAFSVLAVLIFEPDGADIDFGSVLIWALMYPLVFASIGATLKSRTTLRSQWGVLGGIGAFFGGTVLWYLLGDPFEDIVGADSFGDLDESSEYFHFFAEYIATHGIDQGDLLPEWYVMVALVATGAAITYKYQEFDSIAGMGQGARLGMGYVIPVLIFQLAFVGTRIRDINDQIDGSWPDATILEVNSLIALAPLTIVLAGIVIPVAFGAIGGAIGAKIYESQNR